MKIELQFEMLYTQIRVLQRSIYQLINIPHICTAGVCSTNTFNIYAVVSEDFQLYGSYSYFVISEY